MSLHRIGWMMLLCCFAACGGLSSASTVNGLELSAIPSAATLCKLTPHRSTSADARKLLGPPNDSTSFANGTTMVAYEYDAEARPNPMIAVLEMTFASDQTLASATVVNIEMPDCWHFDGGL
jgi:hypothetical protein